MGFVSLVVDCGTNGDTNCGVNSVLVSLSGITFRAG